MIEVSAGVHLSADEVRSLLAVLDAACRVVRPDARAANVIRQLRSTNDHLMRATGGRPSGKHLPLDGNHHAAYDLVDTAEAAAILGISPGGVRYLAEAGRIPAHRAGGRWLYPAEAVIERAERKSAGRVDRRA